MRFLILSFALIFAVMSETQSLAAEVSRPVTLPRQILSAIQSIHLSSQSSALQIEEKQQHLLNVFREVQVAPYGASARQRAEWLALRSEMLLLAVRLVDDIEQNLMRIILDLKRLERVYVETWPEGNSQAVHSFSKVPDRSLHDVKLTLERVETTVNKLDLEMTKQTFGSLATVLPHPSEGAVSFEEEVDLVNGWISMTQSVKQVLAAEQNYLRARFNVQYDLYVKEKVDEKVEEKVEEKVVEKVEEKVEEKVVESGKDEPAPAFCSADKNKSLDHCIAFKLLSDALQFADLLVTEWSEIAYGE